MMHNNDDAMNKIPLKSSNGLDDEEKNGSDFIHDTTAAEEARRERMRERVLQWMKKLTIILICFIGIALISYVVISLCFSEWPKSTDTVKATTATTSTSNSSLLLDDNDNNSNNITNNRSSNLSDFDANNNNDYSKINITSDETLYLASLGFTDKHVAETTIATDTVTTISASTIEPKVNTNSTNLNNSTITTSYAPIDLSSEANIDAENSEIAIQITPRSTTSPPPPPPPTTATTTKQINTNSFSTTTSNTPIITLTPPPTTTNLLNDNQENQESQEKQETIQVITPSPLQDEPDTQQKEFNSNLGVFKKAAVCSDKEICSRIGSNILQIGGSAVDAAIASMLCNGIVTMQSMGIGGGMLMNVYIKQEKQAFSIDAREVAPFDAEANMFDHTANLSLHGGLSIAVPGELMGYHRAHERFGKLPWKTLIEPSLKLCKEGFYMSHHQSNAYKYKRNHIKNNTVLTDVFLNATTGELHPIGTKIRPPKALCDSYLLLAKNGPLDFYNGTLAKLVVADLMELGSIITRDDLESYKADLVSSITMPLGNDVLYVVPPVSSGVVVSHILSILEGYNFTKSDLHNAEREANTIHRFSEAMKFGYAKRWELGDLRFNDVRELVSKLTNPDYGREIRALINDTKVLNNIYDYGAQFMGVDDVGTSHLNVLAPNGDAVSVTSSINDYFGSGQAGKRTGIIFNNGMSDFSIAGRFNIFNLPPAPSNYIYSQKRSMSSMSPMLLTNQNGDIRLALGAAGGSKIISALVEIAARVLWFGQNIKEAIDAPRFHHQLLPNKLEFQLDGFNEKILNLLKAKGHVLEPYSYIGSCACGILRNDTAIYANADYRKRGGVAGF